MPRSAGGAALASSTVHTFSLPIATRCSLTPCSKPQSHSGRDPRSAYAPGSVRVRYCVSSVAAGHARTEALDDLHLLGRAVGVLGEQGSRGRHDAERVAHGVQPVRSSAARCRAVSGSPVARSTSAIPTQRQARREELVDEQAFRLPSDRRSRPRGRAASPAAGTRRAPRTGSSGSRRARAATWIFAAQSGSLRPSGRRIAGSARRAPTSDWCDRPRGRRRARARSGSSRAPSGRR